jgi:hypothetical protein
VKYLWHSMSTLPLRRNTEKICARYIVDTSIFFGGCSCHYSNIELNNYHHSSNQDISITHKISPRTKSISVAALTTSLMISPTRTHDCG